MTDFATLIAIETSTELASVALLYRDEVLTVESEGVQTHSQSTLPMLQSLLRQAGITLADCDAVAFGVGPGSFTGVRTACGVAQGIAFGAGLPVLPIVTLEAMAEAARSRHGATEVLAVLDARMEEVYWAQYRFTDRWNAVHAPALSAASEVLPSGQVVAVGNGLAAYASAFRCNGQFVSSDALCMPHARDIVRLASAAWQRGEACAPEAAQPLYLRNRIALTTAERAAKAAT